MKVTFEGSVQEVKNQIAEFFGGVPAGEEFQPEANGTAAPPKSPGSPRKAAAPPPTDPAAPGPAAPAAAEPVKQMLPLCEEHAKLPDAARFKVIPAEKSACAKCGPPPKASISLAEMKIAAEAFMDSRADGPDIFFRALKQLGAESLTGAENTKALDPAKYEELLKLLPPPDAPAAPAKRSL